MRQLALLALLAAACHRDSPPPSTTKAHAASPGLSGDRIAYRFVAHAHEAHLEGADLEAAWAALSYPAKLVSPWAQLQPGDGPRVVELALADADVAEYGRPHRKARSTVSRFDPVWNRTRAVYESRTCLFAPSGARWRFRVPAVARGELRVELATAPGSPEVSFTVAADGHILVERAITAADSGSWMEVRVPVAGARQIELSTRAAKPAAAFFGDPKLIARDEGAAGPNVVLVIIDTLRRDALPVMPNLRALAARGASFDQAITAATWTRPSVLTMLGGDLPTTIGQSAQEMIPPDRERRRFYATAPPLLPRVLEDRGYQVSAIGNNFFLLGYPQIGLSLGFDHVDDIRHPVLDTPAITEAAEAFLAAHAREAFYLHLHYDAPHWPYTPPPEYLKRVAVPPGFPDDAMARAYLAEAAYADDYLGRVLAALERNHLSERTLVVVLGDHGEVFDHAHEQLVIAMGQPTLHHHGWSAYDEILRVPLVMAMPGTIGARVVPEQVSLVDVEPTIREVLGLQARAAARGRSLLPLVRGEKIDERPAFVEGQNVHAVRAGGWAYLRRDDGRLKLPDGNERRVDEELYDLARDPQEHDDLAARRPVELERMRALAQSLAPLLPEAPAPVVHLQLAPDGRPHTLEGTLRSDGELTVRGVRSGDVRPLDAHTIALSLRGPALLELSVDPPTAGLELAVRKDGLSLEPAQLLVGGFGLPLFAQRSDLRIDGDKLGWLDARRPPVAGERGDVLLWRDPSASVPSLAPSAARNDGEVAGMMRRWGYAQPGK